jgi:hypothetical protein
MEKARPQGLIRESHTSIAARPASPPAPPPVVAAAKEYQDEQYNDEERGVIHAALPSRTRKPCQPYAAPKTAASSPLAGKEAASAAPCLASSVWS